MLAALELCRGRVEQAVERALAEEDAARFLRKADGCWAALVSRCGPRAFAASLLPLLTAPAADASASYVLDAPLAALLARFSLLLKLHPPVI